MRSATSYFNGPLYRKTMARFWPLWAGYGVIWLFFIPLNMLNTYFNRYMSSAPVTRLFRQAVNLPEYVTPGLYFAAFFAIFCAMAVFGYLYNSRSSCWFHALPTRREALFTTQYLAGLSFLLLPQGAVAVLTAMIEMAFLPMAHWGAALSALVMWLLAQSGICLFFFSFAAFCAMFTGHILALPAFYCILNILADVIYTLLDGLFHEFFYGYAGSAGSAQIVEYLTPAYALKDAVVLFGSSEEGQRFRSPGTVAVYAAVGVALALVSLYVYRRRHAETAGDVVAIPLVRPLFKYGVSFCSGLCLGMFSAMFFGWTDGMAVLIASILVWTVIGCFAAEMLLKKSFRVLKAWKGAAVMAVVVLVLCLACLADVFGVVNRVPAPDQVKSVQVELDMGYPNDSGGDLSLNITSPAQIEKILALHKAIVDNRDQEDYFQYAHTGSFDYTYLTLSYGLTGGSLERRYHSVPIAEGDLDTPGTVAYALRQILDDRELVAMAYDFDGLLDGAVLTTARLRTVKQHSSYGGEGTTSVYVEGHLQELWDAVRADFDEGTIGVRYPFYESPEMMDNTYETSLIFGATDNKVADRPGVETTNPANYELEIYLTPQAKHTLAVLDQTGIFEEGYSLATYEPDYYPGAHNG